MVGDPTDGKRDVSLTSGNGKVFLSVPDALSMDIDVELAYLRGKRQNYKIISDFDIECRKTDSWIDDGLASPRKIIYGKGRIKGGLNHVRIRAWNGDVHMKKNEGI